MARRKKRRICAVVGSRRDFDELQWVLRELDENASADLRVLACESGTENPNAAPQALLARAGFKIDGVVPARLHIRKDTEFAAAMDRTLARFRDAFRLVRPDMLLLAGRGQEILAAGVAATTENLPVAYLHPPPALGEEQTTIPGALTRISTLHFVQAVEQKEHVANMGYPRSSVVHAGAPLLDFRRCAELLSKKEFETRTGCKLGKSTIFVHYRPSGGDEDLIAALLSAIEKTSSVALISRISSRLETAGVLERFRELVRSDPSRFFVLRAADRLVRVSALQHVEAMISNSSTSIVEAGVMKRPLLFLAGAAGAPDHVVLARNPAAIGEGLNRVLAPKFRAKVRKAAHPYGSGSPASKIVARLLA